MCGIVGYVGDRQAADFLLEGLAKLEYRGYDSAGIAVYHDGKIKVQKKSGPTGQLEESGGTGPQYRDYWHWSYSLGYPWRPF